MCFRSNFENRFGAILRKIFENFFYDLLFFGLSLCHFIKLYSGDGGGDGLGDEDMVMEDVNTESLAAMKCPLTQQPIKQAARANVSIYLF